MHPLAACLAAAGLLCCALAGCSVNSGGINVPTVSRRALQEDITQRLAEAGERRESVTCKQDLIGEVGTTAHCEVVVSATNRRFRASRAWKARSGQSATATSMPAALGYGAPSRCPASAV